MKRIFTLLFLVFGVVFGSAAQEYQMHIKARLMNNNNDVSCNSHFLITYKTKNGNSWRWYKGLGMDEDKWAEFEHTISFSADDVVTSIDVYAVRRTTNAGGCRTHDSGTNTFTIDESWYPCHSTGELWGYFKGYSDNVMEIDITPLSPSTKKRSFFPVKFDMQAWRTEAYIEPSKSETFYQCVVTAINANGDRTELLRDDLRNELQAGDNYKVQSVLESYGRTTVKQIEVAVTHMESVFKLNTETRTYDVNDNGGDLTVRLSFLPVLSLNSYVVVRYGKPQTPILYSGSPTSQVLPSDNKISLSIPENTAFQWQYSTDNGTSFTNVPAGFGNGNRITMSGKDLFGSNWQTYLFKNIQFQAIYNCSPENITMKFPLTMVPSAPEIENVYPQMESCHGFADAALAIQFNRSLYSNENVYVFVNGFTYNVYPDLPPKLEAGNIFTVTGIRPGAYNIKIQSTFTALGPGYAGGENHQKDTFIETRSAITNFSAEPVAVHCIGGQDGRITVSAIGGTDVYTAWLYQGTNLLQTISLGKNAPNSFTDLKQGSYTVQLRDDKGCEPKENGTVIDRYPTIPEPIDTIALSIVNNVEPLGFGLKNGYVTVRSEFGTSPYQFIWTDAAGTPLIGNAPVAEGSSMTGTLEGIGKGTYRVRVQDANYALASPATETNRRGCYDTLTLFVTEPPLLEVYTREHHFVSCNGYTDGEIVAHATGGRPFRSGEAYEPYRYDWFRVIEENLVAIGGDPDSIAINRPSGVYRVRITDRNGILAWSEDFNLVQPDVLTINFNTPVLRCNGDANGTSQAIVRGGTPDYRYAWSTDESTSAVENLTEGFYSVIVKDVRGCTTFGQTEVKVPNSIDAVATIVAPLCNGYADGSLTLTTTGGVLPYAYAWTNGATVRDIGHLPAGSYAVRIADANGCFIERSYTLADPALFAVDLGPDRVLCKDQVLSLDVALPDDTNARYAWLKDGAAFGNTSAAVLSETGTYRVEVTDTKGCFNSDEVAVGRDETVINASIVVASRVPAGGRVRIANISYPSSDRVAWIIPSAATVLEETPGYLDVSFAAKGEYNVGLTGYKNACETTTHTVVHVVGSDELVDYLAPDEPYIKQFSVTPNPNNGRFTASVELREVGDFSLVLFTGQGTVVQRKDVKQLAVADIDFDESAQVGTGLYVLQLQTREGYATFKVSIVR